MAAGHIGENAPATSIQNELECVLSEGLQDHSEGLIVDTKLR